MRFLGLEADPGCMKAEVLHLQGAFFKHTHTDTHQKTCKIRSMTGKHEGKYEEVIRESSRNQGGQHGFLSKILYLMSLGTHW